MLADEMGLGKTAQTAQTLNYLHTQRFKVDEGPYCHFLPCRDSPYKRGWDE
jgi:hypothetical protein